MSTQQPEALQRYKVGYHTDEWGVRSSTPTCIPAHDGAWVRYADVQALQQGYAAARLEKARRYLKAMGDPRTNSAYFFDDGYPRREIAQDALATLAILEQLAAAPTTQAAPQQDAQEPCGWDGAEEWEKLAWHLCAEENGEDACNELIWEGGPMPEPWGDRWLKYEGEARRMIALVRTHVPAPQPAPAPLSDDAKDAARYRWLRDWNSWYSEPRLDAEDGTRWSLTFYSPQSIEDESDDDRLDAAIDAARAHAKEGGAA